MERLTKEIPNPQGRCITYSEVNHGSQPCDCTGYAPKKLPWSRAALWPGWHLTFDPRPLDRLLGRVKCETTKGEPESVEVPMPEGKYPATLTREERVWKRPRWPWIKDRRVDYRVDLEVGIPSAGKGENSWDCDDDALYGTGGSTPAEAIGNAVKAALRNRANYGEASEETMRKVKEKLA